MLNMIPRVIQPNEIVIKKGALIRLKFLKGKKAFIICGGKSFEKNGYLEKLENYLISSGFELVFFKGVVGDPSEESINEILAKLRESNADWIIGVGGGGVMDSAKVAWALYENQGALLTDFIKPHSIPERSKTKICLIPTTAGSGSEVSNSAVITINGNKMPIISNYFIPEIVILDPNLTTSLPANITAYSAIDAFTHALESYCSNLNNELTNAYCIASGRLIIDNLETAISSPENIVAREKLLYGSMLSGLAQSVTSVGGIHALSHTVAKEIDLPHGNLNAIFLIPLLKFNMQESTRIKEFLNQLGLIEFEKFENWINKIFVKSNMIDKWGPYSKQLNLNEISEATLMDICARTNPRKLSSDAIKSILEATI